MVYGPQGCGKTINAERMRSAFGMGKIVDDWRRGDQFPLYGALILTSDYTGYHAAAGMVERMTFDTAMTAAYS